MAVTFTSKGKAPVQSIAPTAQTAAPVQSPAPMAAKKGQAKKLPLDGIRLDVPMRLRIGHLLSLFGVSGAQLHKMRVAGAVPEPSGYIGDGTRPTPYWLTTHIAPYI